MCLVCWKVAHIDAIQQTCPYCCLSTHQAVPPLRSPHVRHRLSSDLWRTVMCVTKPAQQSAVGWRNHSAITAPRCTWKTLQAERGLDIEEMERDCILLCSGKRAWCVSVTPGKQHDNTRLKHYLLYPLVNATAQEENVNELWLTVKPVISSTSLGLFFGAAEDVVHSSVSHAQWLKMEMHLSW